MKEVTSRYTDPNNMYNTNKIHAIIFDMDGTVLESEGLFSMAEQKLLADYGVNINLDALSEFRGMSEDNFYPHFINKFQICDSIENLKNKLKEYLFAIMESHLCYIDGFQSFYQDTIQKHNLKTALVTNTSIDIVKKVKGFIDIESYIPLIITSSDVSQPKPSPIPYSSAMRDLSVAPEETIIIEDSSVGLLSALDSGAEVFGITSTASRDAIMHISENIRVFDGYSDMSKYLEKRL